MPTFQSTSPETVVSLATLALFIQELNYQESGIVDIIRSHLPKTAFVNVWICVPGECDSCGSGGYPILTSSLQKMQAFLFVGYECLNVLDCEDSQKILVYSYRSYHLSVKDPDYPRGEDDECAEINAEQATLCLLGTQNDVCHVEIGEEPEVDEWIEWGPETPEGIIKGLIPDSFTAHEVQEALESYGFYKTPPPPTSILVAI